MRARNRGFHPSLVELCVLPVAGTTLPFCLVPRGAFRMGSRGVRFSDEEPVHRVTISEDFMLGRTPVTQAQWRAAMKDVGKDEYCALLAAWHPALARFDPPGNLAIAFDVVPKLVRSTNFVDYTTEGADLRPFLELVRKRVRALKSR